MIEFLLRKIVIEDVAYSRNLAIGSLEKTVGASLIALWCVLSSPFFVEKTKLQNLLTLSTKKTSIFYGAKLIFRSFATFFGKAIS